MGNLKFKNGRKAPKTPKDAQSKLLPIVVGLGRQEAMPQRGNPQNS